LGNHPCESSEDNVSAVARLDRTGRLASDQAATSWNHCSVVTGPHVNAVCGITGCAEPLRRGRRQYLRARLDRCTRKTPRRTGGSMVTRTGMQSREGPHSISATAGRLKANSRSVWAWGLAHEGVVAMTPVITSRRSEGPLGHCGRGRRDGPGYCSNELTRPLGVGHVMKQPIGAHVPALMKRSGHANRGEAHRKPKGKALGEMQDLKPYWGNPAVRDFRGGGGNGGAVR